MAQNTKIESVVPARGEETIQFRGGRWLWCLVTSSETLGCGTFRDRHHRYLHVDCDVLCDDAGYCAACGAPSSSVPDVY